MDMTFFNESSTAMLGLYSQARDDVVQTPALIASWLDDECMADREPLDAYRLTQRIGEGAATSVPELLIVAMCAPQAQAWSALTLLRAKFRDAAADDIEMRAAELLIEAQGRVDNDDDDIGETV